MVAVCDVEEDNFGIVVQAEASNIEGGKAKSMTPIKFVKEGRPLSSRSLL
jgi:hypothetical protein